MQEHTKKHPIDELVNVTLQVRKRDLPLLKHYADALRSDGEGSFTVAEVFPEYVGQGKQAALRAYRYREGLTQKQLAEVSGIPQHHISEMENGKRPIGKERAKRLAQALNCDYRQLL
jgi:DNA-binding XRE family transcriptional regulator